ncbi:hypothetical protein [Legionella oakridgensis]|uniref:Uncharacterized protein n=2 Tax=Legionella oakridgensis TaxID=29423 RepID=W0BA78_9GAMM|nr:hypothetical protein [Legionella oakridgensis]AHE65606.1 hypothetical protein Loa_00015 [Legionella oakridgensis ATCC 33761 = DSM 21215]KTD38300.1 hypothetical protein Loak_1976 [Legionella oakridgensis]STY15568.1 Uncharacterised protein [Legionella longbeachae]
MPIYKGILILFLTFLAGCHSIGPSVLHNDRYSYNLALGDSKNQELLLNMVRLRYDHPPVILSVGNISGSTKIQREGRIEAYSKLFTQPTSTESKLEGTTGLIYSDNPIISYTPMDDNEFHTRFLSALSLKHIELLLESSWSIARVFRVTLQRAGDAINASSAARPTSIHMPHYREFMDMVYVLRRLQINDAFIISYQTDNHRETLTLHLNKKAKLSVKEKQILRKAGINLYENKIIFTNYEAPHATTVITRSVLSILNYLSKGVIVPQEDIESHIVKMTYTPEGNLFNWQNALRGMMKINYCEKQPVNAAVAIPYINRWYYIDNRDSNSKQTLMMLTSIIGLISSPVPPSPVGLTRNT